MRNSASIGMPTVRHEIAIAGAHGAGEQLVAHRPAIDHEILPEAVRPVQRGKSGEAFDGDVAARGADGQSVGDEVLAEDAPEPRQAMIEQPRRARLEPQNCALAVERG